MTVEQKGNIPEWAEQERQHDRAWLAENLHVFWPLATTVFKREGRGALVVDTTSRPTGEGHPFGYFPHTVIKAIGDDDTKRMVGEYDPEQEFVVLLLKPQGRTSTYRVRPRPNGSAAPEPPKAARPEAVAHSEPLPQSNPAPENIARPPRAYFTQTEAQDRVGRRVQTRVAFSGVPEGTRGQVISADPVEWARRAADAAERVYDLAIQWDLPLPRAFADVVIPAGAAPYVHIGLGKPLVDWFTKDEYERYLTELPSPSATSSKPSDNP
jgi:hypothetical protein